MNSCADSDGTAAPVTGAPSPRLPATGAAEGNGSMTHGWTRGRIIAAIVALLIVGVPAYFWHLGYIGGQVFRDMPARGPTRDVAAVLISGDMGFSTGLGPDVAARLANDGVAVVGVNSLTFFRRTRSPAEITRLIARAETRAIALGHSSHIVLIGQSFGADMLHVGLAGLPPALRARIVGIVLVVPTDTVEYRASPSEIFSWWLAEHPALPTAAKLGFVPTLCIQGQRETQSLCPLLRQPGVTRVALPGGHPLHHDPDALYAAIRPFVLATRR
jgi:type IV secretory pathway VirJ component